MNQHLYFPLTVCLALAACATRSSKSSLGAAWPQEEPMVNLSAYESVQRRPGQRSDIALAVAISGGGMRAGNFAAGVLQALESIEVRGAGGTRSNLLREVDYFSTVSGGGMAAGSYMAALLDYRRAHPEDERLTGFSFSSQEKSGASWRSALAKNYQSSIVGSFFNPLMLSSGLDRGDVLEKRLDEYVLRKPQGRSRTLRDIFVPKGGGAPHVPYWIANATVYENGAIFPFTPDILSAYSIHGCKHGLRSSELADAYDLPLAVGLKSSASFPVAIPPSTLKSSRDPENPRLHLMDGGVADNLGIVTALRVLRQDKAARKALIVIDAYNGRTEPFSKSGSRPGMTLSMLRTTSISLDSSHQRVRNLLASASRQSGVHCAVLDFHQAVRAGNENQDRTGHASLHESDMSPQSMQALFTHALGVGTWLRIKPSVQEILLKAGEEAIYSGNPNGQKILLPEMQRVKSLF